jgi:L-serine dehydratase
MPAEHYPEFFNDVFGPVMQPGSSSHTAAPCRLGLLANSLLDEPLAKARFVLDTEGSFCGTFAAMSEDDAMLAGAMGIPPDDVRIYEAQQIARQAGIDFAYEFAEMKESTHINALKFVLTGQSGKVVTLVGDSTGGGMVETKVINGYPLRVKGDTYVLLVFDPEQIVSAQQMGRLEIDLAGMVGADTVHTEAGRRLYCFKIADPPDMRAIRGTLKGIQVDLLKPVLPVLTRPERKPQLFGTMTRWREIAAEWHLPLWEVAVQYEMDASGWSRGEVIAYMRKLERTMYRQTHAAYDEGVIVPESPFKTDMAAGWAKHMQAPQRLTDPLTANTIKWAYGAGSGIPGVEVVAGPMGSGGGYIHGALWAVKEAHGFSDDDLLRGLFVAAGVGVIAFTRTDPTGECIGCGGECGVCGAMAAAAIAEMAGGTPQQVEHAASLSLQSAYGIPCDPIAGGMGQPCRSRIIAATCMASVFADLALGGRDAVLPLHEVIDVADAVGRRMPPELLCTSRGGASVAPTAREREAAYKAWFEGTQAEGIVRPPGNLI